MIFFRRNGLNKKMKCYKLRSLPNLNSRMLISYSLFLPVNSEVGFVLDYSPPYRTRAMCINGGGQVES
jgi:hypothetical protein